MINCYLDVESAFDKDYSLSRMSTASYVRDSRWKCLGASVCIPGAMPPTWLEESQLRAFLDGLKPMASQVKMVMHNASFDAFVLSERYGFIAGAYHDTMHQARYAIAQGLLDPELRTSLSSLMPLVGMSKGDTAAAVAAGGQQLAAYANDDLIATMKLHELMPQLPDTEAAISELHIRMAVEPRFVLDVPTLTAISQELPPEGADQLGSADFFVACLRALGVEPQMKSGKRGLIPAFAKTDDFMKELLIHPDPRVRQLAELRIQGKSTIEQTRATNFLACGSPIPVPLAYYKAGTGRTSGANDDDDSEGGLNFQNLPTRGGVPRLRRALMAPEGYKVMPVDSSQVEVRVITKLSGDTKTQSVFDSGQDVYLALAYEMYRSAPGSLTKESRERLIAKSARLGLQFGQRAKGFKIYCARNSLYITDAEASEAVRRFENAASAVCSYWKKVEAMALRDSALTLPSGRRIVYPDLRRGQKGLEYQVPAIFSKRRVRQWEHCWHGSFTNNMVQGTARDLVMAQTVRLDKHLRQLGGQVVLSVHDEAVSVVPEDRVAEATEASLEAFSWVPEWAAGLVVKGEVKVGDNYGVKG